MKSIGRRAIWQAWLLGFIGIVAFVACGRFDVNERIREFLQSHESYELDEMLLALDIVGILSIVYGALRLWDLHWEQQRRKHAETQIDWMALHDHLTGLQNRRSLDQNLAGERLAGSSRDFSILLIDLDGFKRINDLVGHHAGDIVLKMVAERLREQVTDQNIYRIGGDEFVVITEAPASAPLLAQALLQLLNKPVPYNGTSLDIGASIGLATLGKDGGTAADCLRCADAAMYAAKAAGRGALRIFDTSIEERMRNRDLAERNLRHAIAYDGIKPFYQPIIDLHSGEISGFEALARWHLDDGSSIPPSDFIPLAEDSGLITVLTEKLLRQACADAATWPSRIVLSFNISPIQLKDRLLSQRILRILAECGLTPHRLEIEITETAIIQDMDVAAAILKDLRAAGISVALDDFGTGYSNLAQLSNFSFDKIKIDRSFVHSFQDQERQEKIVKAIVGLGLGLAVPTTAEGIETPGQLSMLTDMGCTYGQGYYFGKAVSAEETLRMVTERQSLAASV